MIDCLSSTLKPFSYEFDSFRTFYSTKLVSGGEKYWYEQMPLGHSLEVAKDYLENKFKCSIDGCLPRSSMEELSYSESLKRD